MAAGNVSAVFAGHIHRQRYDGIRDGIGYYTLATVGGRLPMDVPGTGWLHHSLLVSVREEGFQVATVPVGSVLDPREMTPAHLEDLDRARSSDAIRLSGELLLKADGQAGGNGRTCPYSEPRRRWLSRIFLDTAPCRCAPVPRRQEKRRFSGNPDFSPSEAHMGARI